MEVEFDSAALERTCSVDRERVTAYGQESADLIRRRLGQLCAVANLAKLREFKAVKLRSGVVGEADVLLVAAGPKIDLVVRPLDNDVNLSNEVAVTSVLVVDLVSVELERAGHRSDASSLDYERSL